MEKSLFRQSIDSSSDDKVNELAYVKCGESEGAGLGTGWKNKSGSRFQRPTDAYWNEQFVLFKV